MNIHNKQPSIHDYSHDTLLLLSVSYLTAISFYGMQMLLRSLYLLRLGFDTAYLGSYLAAGALGYMVMGIPSGILGNRFGTMAMMRIGGIICLVGMVLLPLTELVSPPFRAAFPFISQLVQISGWSMVNVNLVPALMGTTSSDNRNSSYALASGLREFGSFVGSLFGGFLPGFFSLLRGTSIDTSSPYNSSIWISNGLWFIALVPLFLIKGRGIPTQQHQTQEQGAFPIYLIALLFIYVYLQQVGWAGCQSFCNPYMDQELHYSTANMGIIAAFGQISAIAISFFVPKLLKLTRTGWALVAATFGMSVSLVLLTFSSHWSIVSLGRIGASMAMALWIPAHQVFQMEIFKERFRGVAYGVMSMAMGLGFATLSYTGGYFITTHGYHPLFIICASVSVVAAILLISIQRFIATTSVNE